jgi:hypothetical protein
VLCSRFYTQHDVCLLTSFRCFRRLLRRLFALAALHLLESGDWPWVAAAPCSLRWKGVSGGTERALLHQKEKRTVKKGL